MPLRLAVAAVAAALTTAAVAHAGPIRNVSDVFCSEAADGYCQVTVSSPVGPCDATVVKWDADSPVADYFFRLTLSAQLAGKQIEFGDEGTCNATNKKLTATWMKLLD